jgi:aspartyl-tRNA(Asn)/glutamyl-tRNA(Gln) amidotransferase subunit A
VATPHTKMSEAQGLLNTGDITSVSLTEACLARAKDPLGQGQAVFTLINTQWAMECAALSDATRRAGEARSVLEGIPVSIKDSFDVAGQNTRAGSVVLQPARPANAHSAVTQRLLHAGAVLVGRTNMTEFAYSGLGINPHYATPLNPWARDEQRIPGGSSSGAAVAISDGMCLASVGTDTGGSARIPAALCGIAGFKSTASRIDHAGIIPLAPSLDAVGVLAADVRACAAVDAVISHAVRATPRARNLRQARFAVVTTLVQDGLCRQVAAGFSDALCKIRNAGAELVEVAIPEFEELAALNAGGGFAAAQSYAWHAGLIETNASLYDPKILTRILRGQNISAKDYIDLQRARSNWCQRVESRLADFDGWLMPTVPLVAPRMSELLDSDELYFQVNALLLRNPSIVNFMDGCALSLPCHPIGTAPVGISLAGLPHTDTALLSWGLAIEAAITTQT